MSWNRREFVAALGAVTAQASEQSTTDPFQTIRDRMAPKTPLTWVFTGDSITHGALHTMGARSYSEHFAERVRWELRRTQDMVINSAISGNQMSNLLATAHWRVWRFQPDVVSLMMGMNDATGGTAKLPDFRRNLETFHEDAQQHNALLLLHTQNPIIPGSDAKRQDLPAYVDTIREFAARHNLPLVDHYQYWTEKHKPRDLIYLMSDGAIHPNAAGHVEFANLLFQKLGIFDANSRTCRLFVP